jgi:hypothetical protein
MANVGGVTTAAQDSRRKNIETCHSLHLQILNEATPALL